MIPARVLLIPDMSLRCMSLGWGINKFELIGE